MNTLNIVKLCKAFGDLTALNDVTLEFQAGETNVLLGPNGAGKTTLVKIVLGLLRPSEGIINYNQQKLSAPYSVEEKRLFFYLPDEPIVMDYLTGCENLKYIGALYRADLDREALHTILNEFDLLRAKDRLVKDYSRGMKQRLCLSYLRVYSPEIIILDEPTVGLDILGIQRLCGLVADFKSEGRMIIVCTHDINFGKQVADRILFLKRGSIIDIIGDKESIDSIDKAIASYYDGEEEWK
mgnify:CR=1 FL=1